MLTGNFTKNHAKNPERTKGMVNNNRERKRILFVEDDKDNWEILALSLEEYRLICACDFAEGCAWRGSGISTSTSWTASCLTVPGSSCAT